ncbi:hypothetical protein COV82_02770 [Candidatus Peregrinibacteria bacterium CG11_big_fil_rev_8_21_14_0_20_46_8]|nr:MAG: hypothetical protein COV82_02770 [Candidatus Peregrinibacteria bacterium CG11_big_fil_rev_8_21_14_0_20_46_8]
MAKPVLTDFCFELGMMKKLSHIGSKFAGVKQPDTLAEHSSRSAQIGYLLAILEDENPEYVAAMCTFHDIGEIRVGDQHNISKRYFDLKPYEKKAMEEQTSPLPEAMQKRIRQLWTEFHDQETKASHVARDADLLETMFQAKEYWDIGFVSAKRWLDNGNKFLKTKSAKKIFKDLKKRKFSDWWDHLNTV